MDTGDAPRDLRSASEWYQADRTPLPRLHRPRSALVAAIVLAVSLGGVYAIGRTVGLDLTRTSRDIVYSVFNDVPPLSPLPEPPAPTDGPTPEPTPGTGKADPSALEFLERYRRIAAEHPDVVEGRDYGFIAKVGDAPIRWSCEKPIPVVLAGPVPSGTEATFESVVSQVRDASGLPLTTVRSTDTRPPQLGGIVVYYAALHEQPGTILIDQEETLGRAGPRSYTSGRLAGMIDQGEALVRDDLPRYSPATNAGAHVLGHELIHTLGVLHAEQQRPEVMAPYVNEQWPVLGQGDRVALKIVGCD